MIAGSGTDKVEQDIAALFNHKRTALLERAALYFARTNAISHCSPDVPESPEVQVTDQILPHARSLERLAFRISQYRVFDLELFSGFASLLGRSRANHKQIRSGFANSWIVVTQLRDLFAAKHSAKMPDKKQYRGCPTPQVTAADRISIGVAYLNVAKSCRCGQFHSHSFPRLDSE